MEIPEICFETLTFGELQIGQKFIAMPSPGDNQGHGGFRKAHFMFLKTEMSVAESALGFSYESPTGRAINIRSGYASDFPESMNVILVE